MSGWNPTAIRITKFESLVGMVLANMSADCYYFQVYETREDGHTFLAYSMSWTSQVDAFRDYEAWIVAKENGHCRKFQFSYADPDYVLAEDQVKEGWEDRLMAAEYAHNNSEA
jgi:hypothetical protein